MDYKLALENAQRNVEQQKLALEKANKAIQNPSNQKTGSSSFGAKPHSSSSVDPAKVKQFMERRRLEMEAKKAATMAPQSRPQPPHNSVQQQKNGTNGDVKKGRPVDAGVKKSQDSLAQKRLSDGANGGGGVSASKKSKPSSASSNYSSSSRLPQPPPPPPSSSSSVSGPNNVQRQYLMMRREELLKELEKIDKKLRKLNESDGDKALSNGGQQQPKQVQTNKDVSKPKSSDRSGAVSNLPSVKKLSKNHSTPAPLSRHPTNHSDDDEYNDDEDADSFIDDTEDTAVEDYAKIVREVHRSLKFDPRRYAAVNPHDDCRGMVASYRDIRAEEMRSRRIAALEDAADIRDESERRARREEMRKMKR